MKHLPRAFNRFMLAVIGILLTAIGAGVVALALSPQVRDTYLEWGPWLRDQYSDIAQQAMLNSRISWLTIAWVALAVIAVICLLIWIFSQGGGRTQDLASVQAQSHGGSVTADSALVDQLVNNAIAEDQAVYAVSTSAWKVGRKSGVKIKITAPKGADPQRMHAAASEAIAQLDSLLGQQVPVLVHITSGWLNRSQSRTK